MEILPITEIYFEGTGHVTAMPVPYYIRDEAGEKFWVNIPKIDEVLKAFEWMGESNILGDLVDLTPEYWDNSMDIAGIRDHNEQSFEISVQAGAVIQESVLDPKTFYSRQITSWPGKKDIPAAIWKVTWKFWNTNSAVMMKLALPGAKSATL